jgi:phage terminase large subunit
MAIWIAQFVGREIRLLDYIEGVGQLLAYYAIELRRRGWKDAIICLPHDGVAANNISGKRYIDHWIEAGFECGPLIKNTGAGAAMMRIEAARRMFPRCWFNETTTRPPHGRCGSRCGGAITTLPIASCLSSLTAS